MPLAGRLPGMYDMDEVSSRQQVRVVKVGGSLLDYADLVPALGVWLGRQPPGHFVFLAGGGKLVRAVQEAEARFGLSEETTHWLCLAGMSVTAKLLASLLGEVPLLQDFDSLRRATNAPCGGARKVVVFDAARFLRDGEAQMAGEPLPKNATVTSDSIAARIAELLGPVPLVLLKSADPPALATRRSAVAAGYVDAYFAEAARRLPKVTCVNLRGGSWEAVELGG